MQIAELIKQHAPCAGGVKWLKKHGIKTVSEAYNKCERSDWLIWLLVEVHGIDRRQRVTLSCQIVRTIWHLLSEDDKSCIMTCEKWLAGEATDKELLAASASAASACAACAAAADAAASASYSAHACASAASACAACACAAADDAASYSAHAAYCACAHAAYCAHAHASAAAAAACDAAADAAAADARAAQHAKQCEIIREMFPNPF